MRATLKIGIAVHGAETRELSMVLKENLCDRTRTFQLLRKRHCASKYVEIVYLGLPLFISETASTSDAEETPGFLSFHELNELVQVMPGFLLLLTGEGKLLYLSDNVSEHLGHSMVS